MLKEQLLQRFSAQDLDAQVRARQERFAGLLTEEGALRVLAHENGLSLPVIPVETQPLSTLTQAGQTACVKARVLAAFAPKRFEREGKSGKLCKLRIADASGSADLVLWNKDADFADNVARNDVILLKDVSVKVVQPLELHARFSSEVAVMAEDDATLPRSSVALLKLSEFKEGVEADAYARVVEKQPLRAFTRGDKAGYLSKVRLSDGTTTLWAAAWDEKAHAAQKLDLGDAVKLEGVVLKNGELNLSWSARLLPAPTNHGLPEAAAPYPARPLAELDGSDALVSARLDKVVDAQRLYKCPACGTKNAGPQCACGQKDFPALTYASLEVSDASGQFRAVLFGEAAERLLGATKRTDVNLLAQLKRDYLAGKPITMVAYSKSGRNGEKEIVGRQLLSIQ